VQFQPQLEGHIERDTIAVRLQEFFKADNVPRTRKAVERVIKNIFGIEE
jgi:hypothetical protein